MRYSGVGGSVLLVVSVSLFLTVGCDDSQEPYVPSDAHARETAPEPVVVETTVKPPVSHDSDTLRDEIQELRKKLQAMESGELTAPVIMNPSAIEAEYDAEFIKGINGEDDMVRGGEDDRLLLKSHAVRLDTAPKEGLLLPDLELRHSEETGGE